jgi:hypothetical protein
MRDPLLVYVTLLVTALFQKRAAQVFINLPPSVQNHRPHKDHSLPSED